MRLSSVVFSLSWFYIIFIAVKEAIRRLRENDDDEIEEEIQSWASADVLTVEPPEGVVDVGFV